MPNCMALTTAPILCRCAGRRSDGVGALPCRTHRVVLLGDEETADHPRQLPGATRLSTTLWNHLPVLMKKPGGICNGDPVQGLGTAARADPVKVRAKLKQHADGDRQLGSKNWARCWITAWPRSRPPSSEKRRRPTLPSGDATRIGSRHAGQQPATLPNITTPEGLRLKIVPVRPIAADMTA